jgi:glc operon protein GlcG
MSDDQDATGAMGAATRGARSTGGVNRRQALGLAGVAAAGAVGSTVLSTPAAAATPDGGVLRQGTVSLELTEEILDKAVEYVEDNGLPAMFVVVVDAAGDVKASRRMDGNGPASTVLAPVKAHTALSFRTPTADLASRVSDPAAVASFTTAGFSLLGGGAPIVVDDAVVGAVGVGGGSPQQDDEVARAALEEALG